MARPAKKLTRKKKKKKKTKEDRGDISKTIEERNFSSSSSPHIFQTLISAIRSQGLKLPVLKTLYYLVTNLSLHEEVKSTNCEAASNFEEREFSQYGVTMTFKEIHSISDILFEELDGRFKQLFTALRVFSRRVPHGRASLHTNIWASIDELMLLLRCCMVILMLLAYDQNILIEKGCVLLSILSRLICVEFGGGNVKNLMRNLVSQGCTWFNDSSAPAASLCTSDLCHTSVCSLLEVAADELLMHRSLREYFMLIDYASSTSGRLFMCHFDHGNIGTVLEVVAAQFILSLSDEQAFEGFLSRLFCQPGKHSRIPQMSLNASLSLLLCPVLVSAPKMFQAYVFSLVSEVISIGLYSEDIKPDRTTMDCYLTTFERSVVLYTRSMSNLHVDGDLLTSSSDSNLKSCMLGSGQLAFGWYLQPATKDKICHLVTKLNNQWDSYMDKRSHRTKSGLVDASIEYINSLHVLDEDNKRLFLSILDFIVRRAACDDTCGTVLNREGGSPQDMYFIASLLKLMSTSMLQAIGCLRRSSDSGCLKSLQDVSMCKEYDFMVHLMGRFQQINFTLPIQKLTSDPTEAQPTRHKESMSMWMFFHIFGLLSLSYAWGFDFLVKECLFTLMCLLNLLAFEEGSLNTVSSLFCSGKFSDKGVQASGYRKSSRLVAIKFQKTQMMYLSNRSLSRSRKSKKVTQPETSEHVSSTNHVCSASDMDMEEETGDFCTGEVFLNCVLEDSSRPSDFDELADFIECDPRKDYAEWLKHRQKFRKWKCERRAAYIRKRTKKHR